MARRSTKVRLFGYVFDSKGEAARAIYLKALENNGVITDLVFDKKQLKIILQPSLVIPELSEIGLTRRTMRAITYTPDFRYMYKDVMVWEDSKALNKKTGLPLIESDSRLRIKWFQEKIHAGVLDVIMRVVTCPTADPDDTFGYWYSMNEKRQK